MQKNESHILLPLTNQLLIYKSQLDPLVEMKYDPPIDDDWRKQENGKGNSYLHSNSRR